MNAAFFAFALAAAVCALASGVAEARDEVKIAGSSTVLPYAKITAELFQKSYPQFKAVVESGGSGAGIREFCKGAGTRFIDIVNASRPMNTEELKACERNGVTGIITVLFGYDGIVFASHYNGPEFRLTPRDVYMALAERVPVKGVLRGNTAQTWRDVNPALPGENIVIYLPGEKHGTRDVFNKQVLAAGCRDAGADRLFDAETGASGAGQNPAVVHINPCIKTRTNSGRVQVIDIDGDYTEMLLRLENDRNSYNVNSIGVFGLAFYENNKSYLRASPVNNVEPSKKTIADHTYPVSRPLFFYVKTAHLGRICGLKEYVNYFVSEKNLGKDGPLADYGLVPLPRNEFAELTKRIKIQIETALDRQRDLCRRTGS
jgi:phosphate transport system substrate-binding protein